MCKNNYCLILCAGVFLFAHATLGGRWFSSFDAAQPQDNQVVAGDVFSTPTAMTLALRRVQHISRDYAVADNISTFEHSLESALLQAVQDAYLNRNEIDSANDRVCTAAKLCGDSLALLDLKHDDIDEIVNILLRESSKRKVENSFADSEFRDFVSTALVSRDEYLEYQSKKGLKLAPTFEWKGVFRRNGESGLRE